MSGTTLVDRQGVTDADPGRLRDQSTRLGAISDELTRLAGRLLQVSTDGVWDSGAGRAFAAHVANAPATMTAVAARLGDAAALLPPYAALLHQAQDEMRSLDREYVHEQQVVDECDRRLEVMPPEAPQRVEVERRRGEAARRAFHLQERFVETGEGIVADEKRLAAALREVGATLADPTGYDFFEGMSAVGTSAAVNNVLVTAIPVLRPIALAQLLDPIGRLGMRYFYGQGSYSQVARLTATTTLEVAVPGVGKGARAAGAARASARTAQVQAAKATGRGRIGQTTAQVKVRAKHAAQDQAEKFAGIRLGTNMAADTAALAGAGRLARSGHVLRYTAASAQHAWSVGRTARTVGETIAPPKKGREKKSVAADPSQ